MPRYFFHIQDGYSLPDADGTELPDVRAARQQAIRTAGEILRDIAPKFWDGTEWAMEVTDEQDQILFILRFSAERRSQP